MGSPLETFYILFKTDAGDVEKGTKKARGSVDDLETSISGADKSATTLGKNFNLLAGTAVAAFGVVLAISQLLESAKTISAQSKNLNTLGKVLGENTVNLTNWGRAVQNVGGTVEGFEGSVSNLASQLNSTLINGVNSTTEALVRLGVNVFDSEGKMRSVLTLLPEIAEKFKDLNRQAALAFGAELGIDEGTILLLRKGEAGVRALVQRQAELNSVTEEDTERLARLSVQFEEFSNLVDDFGTGAVILALDAFEGFGPAIKNAREESEILNGIFEQYENRLERIKNIINLMVEGFKQTRKFLDEFVLDEFIDKVNPLPKNAGSVSSPIKGDNSARLLFAFLADKLGGGDESAGLLFDLLSDKLGDRPENQALGLLPGLEAVLKFLIEANRMDVSAIGAGARVGGDRTSSIIIEELNVITQATDVVGIGEAISGALEIQLQNAIDNTDDGIAA